MGEICIEGSNCVLFTLLFYVKNTFTTLINSKKLKYSIASIYNQILTSNPASSITQ